MLSLPLQRKEVFSGTKTLKGPNVNGFSFGTWQTKNLNGIKHFYFNGSSSYPITEVGTGTFVYNNGNQPVIGSLSGTIYRPDAPESSRPLTLANQRYVEAAIVAANDGFKISIGGQDLSNYEAVVLVARSTAASTPGKLTIRDSDGDDSTCAFTTSSTANTWKGGAGEEAIFFEFQNDGSNGVTHTGTFDSTSIDEIEVSGDTADTDIACYEVYFVDSIQKAIGYTWTLQQSCIDSMTEELSREMSDVLCNQSADSSIATGDSYSKTITVKKEDLAMTALAMGDVITKSDESIVKEYEEKLTVTNNTATYPANLNVFKIFVGEQPLNVFYKSQGVPTHGYYDDKNGELTLSGLADGTKLTLFYAETAKVTSTVFKALEQGYYGYLSVPKVSENQVTRILVAKKAQMMLTGKSAADDGSTVDIQFKFYADENGVYAKEVEL